MVKEEDKVRLDKWLWAARFFKTRSQAAQAVNGGKVHVNGSRSKPARQVNVNDVLSIQKGPYKFIVTVRGISSYRRPAPEARELYEESQESLAERAKQKEEKRLRPDADIFFPAGRPSKRDRRLIKKFIRKS